ncbi:hypothetical protein EJ08DRAFT_700726 [Tothia fuscella]|uniref:RBR-type E3 ubiquitin transferase n=1 Tax=Tothia fuscella TaxID=1048955 RepID=A0A9P4NKJ4_9PEZI|nr:hypothetical protein EJ08DRAFT_700726 [Tothia fuscella]
MVTTRFKDYSGAPSLAKKPTKCRKRKICITCEDPQDLGNLPRLTKNCTHAPGVYRECFQRWVSTRLEDTHQIPCPECPAILEHSDLKAHLDNEVFDKYDALATLAALSELSEFYRCVGPECKSGQLHFEGDNTPVVRCDTCGHKAYFTHKVSWHEGESCTQYEQRVKSGPTSAEEQASIDEIARVAKRCPLCKSPIEKAGGCDHMKCIQCKYEFCFSCLANYQEIRHVGNSAHNECCKFYVSDAYRLEVVAGWDDEDEGALYE